MCVSINGLVNNMYRHPSLRPLLTALRTASVVIPAASLSTVAIAQTPVERPTREASAFELPAQDVVASEAERGDGPVDGYVASRSQTGTKTDTPILQVPQSISVITADRMRDQGALTLQEVLRYTTGVRARRTGWTAVETSHSYAAHHRCYSSTDCNRALAATPTPARIPSRWSESKYSRVRLPCCMDKARSGG